MKVKRILCSILITIISITLCSCSNYRYNKVYSQPDGYHILMGAPLDELVEFDTDSFERCAIVCDPEGWSDEYYYRKFKEPNYPNDSYADFVSSKDGALVIGFKSAKKAKEFYPKAEKIAEELSDGKFEEFFQGEYPYAIEKDFLCVRRGFIIYIGTANAIDKLTK